MTAWRALTHAALPDEARADRVVAIRKGTALRHTCFVHEVQRWRAAFSTVPGPAVALYFEDTFDFSAALYGAWHAGKTVVLASNTQRATLERLLPQVDACAGLLPGALQPVKCAGSQGALAPLLLENTRLVLYTSGSSSEPEQICKRLGQLDAEVHCLQSIFSDQLDRLEPAEVFASVSHQHVYGLLFRVLWPLAAARPVIAEQLIYPEEVVARLAQAKNAVLVSSPALLSRLPRHLDWESVRPALRAVFCSGGPLPADASRQCLELMARSPTEIFGSSETGGIAWRRRAESGEAWTLMPGVHWRVRDSLLEVRSPHVLDGARWLTTSDLVQVHEQVGQEAGFVLKGRADRIVKVAEKRVSLSALETVLHTCADVKVAKAVLLSGEPPNEGAARIAVVAELTEQGWQRLFAHGRRAMAAHLRTWLLPHMERVVLPRRWRYVERMPVDPQGKTSQQSLRHLFRPVLPPCEWLKREETQACAALQIDPNLLVFDGHFPQAPVVPGVAQLHWVHCFARQCFDMPINFLRAETLKFQLPILPGQQVQLTLQWSPDKNALRFSLCSAAGTHAGGSLLYEAQP